MPIFCQVDDGIQKLKRIVLQYEICTDMSKERILIKNIHFFIFLLNKLDTWIKKFYYF